MKETRGRKCIFAGKRTRRLQGVITEAGARMFEQARKRLAKAAGVGHASDADTIDYLVRVESEAGVTRSETLIEVEK